LARLRNFALVYADGTIGGSVNNVSGSANDIDLRVTLVGGDVEEVTTNSRGNFELSGRLEGSYSAVIEDAGFGRPCLTAAGGTPDDDGPVDTNDDDEDLSTTDCLHDAPTSISGSITGRADYATMGTLHVYNATEGSDDNMTGVEATGIETVGDTAVILGTAATGITQDAGDSTEVTGGPGGTVVYRGGTVTVTPTLMDPGTSTARRARAAVTVNGPTTACPGGVCTLLFNATGVAEGAGTARENLIRVRVTAHNGYNDHLYTFTVSRAAPMDNVLEAAEITGGGVATDGAGTLSDAFTTTTASATATTVTLTIGLGELGTGENAYCGQSVSVRVYNGDDVDAAADTEDDACSAGEDNDDGEGEQYTLTAGELYELTVMSEDDEPGTYYLAVNQGS
jgi:hypothetical protein